MLLFSLSNLILVGKVIENVSFCQGVDLVPIKSIANVLTLQGDITTQKCRQVMYIRINLRKTKKGKETSLSHSINRK